MHPLEEQFADYEKRIQSSPCEKSPSGKHDFERYKQSCRWSGWREGMKCKHCGKTYLFPN